MRPSPTSPQAKSPMGRLPPTMHGHRPDALLSSFAYARVDTSHVGLGLALPATTDSASDVDPRRSPAVTRRRPTRARNESASQPAIARTRSLRALGPVLWSSKGGQQPRPGCRPRLAHVWLRIQDARPTRCWIIGFSSFSRSMFQTADRFPCQCYRSVTAVNGTFGCRRPES